ncbi:MAG: hypothetical protein M3Y87_08150 [Myxococcota bacterium]|nr:hypothetical protein [Myxococcota bacterium]
MTFAVVVAGWIFVQLPMRTLRELVEEESTFASGHEVEVLEVVVIPARGFGPFHTFGVSLVSRDGDVERADVRGPFVVLSGDAIPIVDERVRALRDPVGGQVATTLEHSVRSARWLAALVVSAFFMAPIVALLAALVSRLREHHAVRRAARSSEELLVDVEGESRTTIRYDVVAPIEAHAGGYRSSARPARWLARYRQRADERPPLIIEGSETRQMIVLRTKNQRGGVVVRTDFWPFVVEGEARSRANARVEDLKRP